MSDDRDQLPGLFPPAREWTVAGMLGALLLALLVLLPWAVLFVLVWALTATP